jgi:hypothetical protein
MVVAGLKCVPSAEEFPSFPLVTTTNLWEPVMATITELARAKMITAMALAIGEERANVLATALNLDGQLASRSELQAGLQAASLETLTLRDEMRAGFLSASRENEELRRDMEASIAGLRSDVDAKIDGLKDSMVREMHRQTRQLFVGMISLMATVFAMLGGLLAITGKL